VNGWLYKVKKIITRDRDRKKLQYLPPNMPYFVYGSDDILPEEENERCNYQQVRTP